MQALHLRADGTFLDALAARGAADRASLPAQVASVAFFAALTAATAQFSVHLPFSQVPVTFQPIVVLLSGLVLGARLGAISQCLYLAAGIAGLPVFALSATLPMGPYPFAAYVVGACAQRGLDRRWAGAVLAMVLGLAVIYACGVLWLGSFARLGGASAAIGLGQAFATGIAPFVIADVLKIAVVAGVVPALWRFVGPSGGR
jgi:biotin transport system substrate-specific component